jgi:threonine/homoserine/homoserine lactone efflux protein
MEVRRAVRRGYRWQVRSVWEFVVTAIVVTLTPGPATATVMRVAARDGRRAAMSAVAGNSVGVLMWGVLSAFGVSSLILASQVAYDALRVVGAGVLIALGVRSLLHRNDEAARSDDQHRPRGWRTGVVTSMANPKLAVFFVALFPQFLSRGAPVLPYALAMAATIVVLDVIWFASLATLVVRARGLPLSRVRRWLDRTCGTVMIGLGARLATESH